MWIVPVNQVEELLAVGSNVTLAWSEPVARSSLRAPWATVRMTVGEIATPVNTMPPPSGWPIAATYGWPLPSGTPPMTANAGAADTPTAATASKPAAKHLRLLEPRPRHGEPRIIDPLCPVWLRRSRSPFLFVRSEAAGCGRARL